MPIGIGFLHHLLAMQMVQLELTGSRTFQGFLVRVSASYGVGWSLSLQHLSLSSCERITITDTMRGDRSYRRHTTPIATPNTRHNGRNHVMGDHNRSAPAAVHRCFVHQRPLEDARGL